MVGTPGPANLLVMSAGAQHGYRTCLPFMFGLIGGKLLLNIAMVLGLLSLIGIYPVLAQLFTYASAIYMTWLALQGWDVGPSVDSAAARPSFRQGLWVHPLNPKAWVMSTLAFSQFGAGYEEPWQRYVVIPLSFAVAQRLVCCRGSTANLLGRQPAADPRPNSADHCNGRLVTIFYRLVNPSLPRGRQERR